MVKSNKEHWSALSTRVDDILKQRESLFEVDKDLESLAQQYASQLISISVDSDKIDYKGYRWRLTPLFGYFFMVGILPYYWFCLFGVSKVT